MCVTTENNTMFVARKQRVMEIVYAENVSSFLLHMSE